MSRQLKIVKLAAFRSALRWALCVTLSILVGCSNQMQWSKHAPLKSPPISGAQSEARYGAQEQTGEKSRSLTEAGGVTHKRVAEGAGLAGLALPESELQLNADALPLPRFIDMALGELLQLNYEISPMVSSRADAVTMHVGTPVPAKQLLGMVQSTLLLYKVGLVVNESGSVQVVPADQLRNAPPLLNAQQELAMQKIQLGRVIEFMPLNYITGNDAANFAQLFINREAGDEIRYVKSLNALMLIGAAESLPRIREAIALLDQPPLQNQSLQLIRPTYWPAKSLITTLTTLLSAQGVPIKASVSQEGSGLAMFPIDELNAMVLISPQPVWAQAAEALIAELDVPDAAGSGSQIFVYFLKNTRADDLGQVIGQALGQKSSGSSGQAAAPTSVAGGLKGLDVITDSKRNALIFVGDANVYQGILPLLKSLDRTPRQVMLEVTVADVSLDRANSLGVVWSANDVKVGSTLGSLSTLGLGLPDSAGIRYALSSKNGDINAALAAIATDTRTKILSTPRILVVDGESANIVVGDQVSVITSSVTDASAPSGVTQGFSFVDTGVILDIKPTINEGGLVQIDLSQEVSGVKPGAAGSNPTISKRKLQTKLVARSGQTVVIGGMIRQSSDGTKTKVPILGDLPFISALFSGRTESTTSSELILIVTPHVIESVDDADRISAVLRKQLVWLDDVWPQPMPDVDTAAAP